MLLSFSHTHSHTRPQWPGRMLAIELGKRIYSCFQSQPKPAYVCMLYFLVKPSLSPGLASHTIHGCQLCLYPQSISFSLPHTHLDSITAVLSLSCEESSGGWRFSVICVWSQQTTHRGPLCPGAGGMGLLWLKS